MAEIRISTVADLRGVKQLQDSMGQLLDQSKKIRDTWKETQLYIGGLGSMSRPHAGGNGATTRGPGLPSPLPTTLSPQRVANGGLSPSPAQLGHSRGRSVAGKGAGMNPVGGYNLNTVSGLIEWDQNVLQEAVPALTGLGSRSAMANIAGVRYQGRPVQRVTSTSPASEEQLKQWFHGLSQDLSKMDNGMLSAYARAGGLAGNSAHVGTLGYSVRDFANQYGGALDAPTGPTVSTMVPVSQTFGQRLRQHFTNNLTGGRTLGGALLGGLKGAAGGALIDAALGGGEAGAAAGGIGAGVIGDIAGGPIGAIAGLALSAVGGQLKQGITNWKEAMPAFSQMSHALLNATNSVEGFMNSVTMGAAKVGETMAQSTAAAQTLSSVYGTSLGMRGLARQVQLTGAFSMVNGLTPSQGTAISATAAQLGITNGVGSTMSPLAYSNMLTNVVQSSRMQGRQGPVFTGLSSVYAGLGAVNPIINNPQGTAGIYAAMNATGIQGLQGQAGASILSTMNSNIGSGGGVGSAVGMAAIYKATHGRINNPIQMLSVLEGGMGARIPGTHMTVGQAISRQIGTMSGGNIYDESLLLSTLTNTSINQSMAMIKSGALKAGSISTKNHLTTRATTQDLLNEGSNMKNVETSRAGFVVQGTKAAAYALAGAPTHVSLAGPNGNLYTGNLSHSRSHPSSGTPLTSPIGRNAIRSSVPATLGKSRADFIKAVLPAARTASAKTGYPVADLISEWALETTWGTSTAAQKDANLAGIVPFGKYKAGLDSEYAGFKNLQQFAQADATVLNNPRYAGARKLAMSGASPQKVFSALDSEGYTGTPPDTPPSMYGAGVQADYQTVKLDRASIDEIVNGFAREVTHQLSSLPRH